MPRQEKQKQRAGTYNARDYLDTLRIKESGASPNNGLGAKGDLNSMGRHKALGPYQIWESFFKDASEYDDKIGDEWNKVLNDKSFSEKVIDAHYTRHAGEQWNRLKVGRGTRRDIEHLARMHNGGPTYKTESTDGYYSDFNAIWKATPRTQFNSKDSSSRFHFTKPKIKFPTWMFKDPDDTHWATPHEVKRGDNLWDISKDYYGTGTRWKEISQYNGLTTETLKPGIQLQIPMMEDTPK